MRGGRVRGCPPCGFSRGKGGGWRHVPQPGGIEGERADEERRTGGGSGASPKTRASPLNGERRSAGGAGNAPH